MNLRNIWLSMVLFVAAMAVTSCTSTSSTNGRTKVAGLQIFQVKGVIKEILADGRTARIAHEEIPGYMVAMTMPLSVKDAKELSQVKAGDAIQFRMLVTAKDGWIDQVHKIGDGEPSQPQKPRSDVRLVRNVDELNIGDTIPNYAFTNELGKVVRLTDFKGKAIVFTFIFTRCPFPIFCPRMTGNFSEAHRKLTSNPYAPKNWHLFSISFDTEYDNPKVLLSYAKTQGYAPKRWSFLTGALIDIDAITEQFGLMFPRNDTNNGFDHNMRTVVVNAAGKVHKIIKGNDWKVDDLVAEIIAAANVTQ